MLNTMPFTAKTLQYVERAYRLEDVNAPTGIGEAGDVATGNKLVAFVRVTGGVVEDVGFKFYSCVATMASAAALAELARGKTREEASTSGGNLTGDVTCNAGVKVDGVDISAHGAPDRWRQRRPSALSTEAC